MSIHKSVTRSWPEVEVEGQEHKTVLVVETTLKVSPDDPDFDSSEFDDLVNAAVEVVKNSAVFDSVRVIPKV